MRQRHSERFFPRPYPPGSALVRDGVYHKDPIIAQGMTDAFSDAELLADAIDDPFAGRSSTENALVACVNARSYGEDFSQSASRLA